MVTRPSPLRPPAPDPSSLRRSIRTRIARLARPATTRQMAYTVAVLASAFAVGVTLVEPRSSGGWAAFLALLALGAPLVPPRHRTALFGVGAAVVATWAGDAPWLAFTVGSAVLVAVAEDRHDVAWRGWAFGLVGCVSALVISPEGELLSPFVGVLVGGLGGLLVRSRAHRSVLELEAGELRGHTEWLEQRTAIARELHDVVGHQVTAIVVQAEAGLVSDPRAALETIGGLGRAALTELDGLVGHLRDPLAPLAVTAAPRLSDVDELLAAPLRRSGVVVEVEVDPRLDLAEAVELAVYRITQEALTNVARHARATRAWVEVIGDDHRVRLRVTDDGVGPGAHSGGDDRRGSGLVGIDERVTGLGGHWSLSGRPGGGTVIDVELPGPAVAPA